MNLLMGKHQPAQLSQYTKQASRWTERILSIDKFCQITAQLKIYENSLSASRVASRTQVETNRFQPEAHKDANTPDIPICDTSVLLLSDRLSRTSRFPTLY